MVECLPGGNFSVRQPLLSFLMLWPNPQNNEAIETAIALTRHQAALWVGGLVDVEHCIC